MAARDEGSAGFSLFELVVVLILIGLVTALVAPSFSRGLEGLELEAAARDLVTVMKQARSRAIAGQQVSRVLLVREEESEEEEEAFVDHYVMTNEYERELRSYPLPDGVLVQLEEEEFPVKISFYANGRSSGGRFALKNRPGRIVWIVVDPITGLAKVERDAD